MRSGPHSNRFRYYDPSIGRYISADPVGQVVGSNVYAYVLNNPMYWIDPLGLKFTVTVTDSGGRNGPTYGGTATVATDHGTSVTVPASSHPNPNNPSPGVADSTSDAVYRDKGHQGKSPGVRLEDGGPVPTAGPNPAQGGASFATGINIHCGDSMTNRGSAGCITISPDKCGAFFGAFNNGETGTVTIQRPQPNPNP
jgi:uncharacterized protein RhaS with RHS repeats